MLENFFSIGAVARSILKQHCSGTEILAYVSQVNDVVLYKYLVNDDIVTCDQIESNNLRCPNPEYAKKMAAAIAIGGGDSIGGCISCIVRSNLRNLVIEHVLLDELEEKLAKAIYSIPAAIMTVVFHPPRETFIDSEDNEATNQSYVIQGRKITIIKMRIAFGPTSTIAMGIIGQGRSYPCLLPLAVPLVEAAVASEVANLLMALVL